MTDILKSGAARLMFGDWTGLGAPRICFAPDEGSAGGEGDGGAGGGEGAGTGASADGDPPAGGAGDAPAGGEAQQAAAASWRDAITDPDLRKQADRFNAPEDALRSVAEMRKKLSNAIVQPSKDASDEDVAAYRKRIGVPDAPDKYDMPVPEGYEQTEYDKQFRDEVQKTFHSLNLNNDQAKGITEWWNNHKTQVAEAEKKANDAYVAEKQAELKKDWPGDEFAKNQDFGNRGLKSAAEMAGVSVDDLLQIKTEHGNYLLDNPDMVRLFSALGREMGEDRIGISEMDRETVQEEIKSLRQKRSEAQRSGRHQQAAEIDKKLMDAYKRAEGDQPIVGSGNRSV